MAKKIKRVSHCCPHQKLPKGMTERRAILDGWLHGYTKGGKKIWVCPKGIDRLNNALDK